MSTDFRLFLISQNISQHFSSAYNSNANGMPEWINSVIDNIPRTQTGKNLQATIRTIDRGLNYNVNRTTNLAPKEAIRKPNPIYPCQRTIFFSTPALKEVNDSTTEKELARKNEQHTFIPAYKLGDLVLTRNFQRSKLEPYWIGPHPISCMASNEQVFGIDFDSKRTWFNIKHIYQYQSGFPLSEVRERRD